MQRKILTLALGAALGTLPMASMAELTLYGHAHGSIDYVDNDDDSGLAVSSNSSRIGVKGSEDLGNGLSAVYKIEWQADLTDNSGKDMGQRNRYVGLKSKSAGTFLVGRHDTPMKIIGRKVDLFYSSQLGENRNVTALDGFDARLPNAIGWMSPSWSGFQLFAVYSADAETSASGANGNVDTDVDQNGNTEINGDDAYSISATYTGGGFYLGAAYEVHNREDGSAGACGAADCQDSRDAIRLVGSYTGGAFKLTAFGQAVSDAGFVDGNDRDSFGVGGSYKFGNNVVKAQWYYADELDEVDNSDGSIFSVGLDHHMSKTTMVYVTASATDNEDNSAIQVGGAGHDDNTAAVAPGDDSMGVSVGMRKLF